MTKLLSIRDVAKASGLSEGTIKVYRDRSKKNPSILPPPDGRVSDSPFWHEETITEWMKTRKAPTIKEVVETAKVVVPQEVVNFIDDDLEIF